MRRSKTRGAQDVMATRTEINFIEFENDSRNFRNEFE